MDFYRPCFEGGRYDLIFGLGARLLRVQCKWAPIRNNVVTIRCYSSRREPDGYIKRSYSSDEIDVIAAYCAELDRCFLVPVDRVDRRPTVHLRVVPTRNNQVRRVNHPEDFRIRRYTTDPLGAIAQLGERLLGMQKVAGSSPAGSIRVCSTKRSKKSASRADGNASA
jgi:PD-(D/E)XK endonuclease